MMFLNFLARVNDERLGVAALQLASASPDPRKNADAAELALAREANRLSLATYDNANAPHPSTGRRHLDILLLPELALARYDVDDRTAWAAGGESLHPSAAASGRSPTLAFMARAARRHRCYVVGTALEAADDGNFYDALVVARPNGSFVRATGATAAPWRSSSLALARKSRPSPLESFVIRGGGVARPYAWPWGNNATNSHVFDLDLAPLLAKRGRRVGGGGAGGGQQQQQQPSSSPHASAASSPRSLAPAAPVAALELAAAAAARARASAAVAAPMRGGLTPLPRPPGSRAHTHATMAAAAATAASSPASKLPPHGLVAASSVAAASVASSVPGSPPRRHNKAPPSVASTAAAAAAAAARKKTTTKQPQQQQQQQQPQHILRVAVLIGAEALMPDVVRELRLASPAIDLLLAPSAALTTTAAAAGEQGAIDDGADGEQAPTLATSLACAAATGPHAARSLGGGGPLGPCPVVCCNRAGVWTGGAPRLLPGLKRGAPLKGLSFVGHSGVFSADGAVPLSQLPASAGAAMAFAELVLPPCRDHGKDGGEGGKAAAGAASSSPAVVAPPPPPPQPARSPSPSAGARSHSPSPSGKQQGARRALTISLNATTTTAGAGVAAPPPPPQAATDKSNSAQPSSSSYSYYCSSAATLRLGLLSYGTTHALRRARTARAIVAHGRTAPSAGDAASAAAIASAIAPQMCPAGLAAAAAGRPASPSRCPFAKGALAAASFREAVAAAAAGSLGGSGKNGPPRLPPTDVDGIATTDDGWLAEAVVAGLVVAAIGGAVAAAVVHREEMGKAAHEAAARAAPKVEAATAAAAAAAASASAAATKASSRAQVRLADAHAVGLKALAQAHASGQVAAKRAGELAARAAAVAAAASGDGGGSVGSSGNRGRTGR